MTSIMTPSDVRGGQCDIVAGRRFVALTEDSQISGLGVAPQTNGSMARGLSSDARTRPTQVGSVPTTSAGVGNSACSGASLRITPGAAARTRCAPSLVTSVSNSACTATEWVVTTGTLTQVACTLRLGSPSIFRD